MPTVMPTWVQLVLLACGVCFILGLEGLSRSRTARRGNLLGAGAAVVACAVPFLWSELDLQHVPLILTAIAVGAFGGVVGAQRVSKTTPPPPIALFTGLGGGAAALVALVELRQLLAEQAAFDGLDLYSWTVYAAVAFAVLAGSASFAGAVVTFTRLRGSTTSRPVLFPGLPFLLGGCFVVALALGVQLVQTPAVWLGAVLGPVGLALGVLLVLPVRAADLPVVVSLLNALTGLTVAAVGYLLGSSVLLMAGALVGATGSVLTLLMARAKGRSVPNVLFGALRGGSASGEPQVSDRPVRSGEPEEVASLLGNAERVIVVPGYGLALAQAQHTLRELVEVLVARGTRVDYAIHPVAGRMPGHMNALLSEAQVPYEQLVELDRINPEFAHTDVVLVVGANDVVNPAARTTPSAPIHGMPILNADQAAHVVFLKRSMRPGFAGIENELLFAPTTTLLLGDAKESLGRLIAALRAV